MTRTAVASAELDTMLATMTDSVQVFDASGRMLSRNPAAARLYELDEAEPTVTAITARWEPIREDGVLLPEEDRPLARVIRSGRGENGTIVGLRRRFDGRVRWLSVSTEPIREAEGSITGYVSCARDLTEQMETIRGLRVLAGAAATLSSSLVPEDVIAALTAAASELGSSPGERPRRSVLMVVDGETLVLRGLTDPTHSATYASPYVPIVDNPYAQTVLATGETLVTGFRPDDFGPSSSEVIRAAGVRNSALVPLRRGGAVFAILAVSGRQESMISESILTHLNTLATIGALAFTNAEAHQRASDDSRTDVLTLLGNRRALEERFAHLPRRPFAVLAIDVDHLKAVNDAHGHDAGDRLLRGIASAMAHEIRPADILVRTGGDEFVALLIDCDAPGAREVRCRLLAAVGVLRLPWGEPSVCIGYAAGEAGVAPSEILAQADAALYREKQQR